MLIDSNILIYAINADSPKHKQSQDFLQKNLGNLEIAHQNVLETLRILTHPKFSSPMSLKKALEAVQVIIESCQIVCPNLTTFYLWLEFVKKYQLTSNRIFDAYLAACALTNSINTIATDNVLDFRKFPGLKTINPFKEV